MTIVGIDLGTSHAALAYGERDRRQSVAIAQVESPGQVARHLTMPSMLYLPMSGEVQANECRLPWQDQGEPDAVIGAYAKHRSAEVPDRVITSAKSWLCQRSVDRRAAILPWQSSIEEKLSPVDASARYLGHLWQSFRYECEEEPTRIVLTVPASFDEVARSLTEEAAVQAGIPADRLTLLEEPQAALYAWIGAHEDSWRDQLDVGDVILVCDVGGGTTDFSLITVSEVDGDLALERIAVGDHLLLGGDNMDLALAYTLQMQLAEEGVELDTWQFGSLVAGARAAKESLLSDATLEQVPIAIASRGSSLFAKTQTVVLTRDVVAQVLVEGFFPRCDRNDAPAADGDTGFQELGLHYETDAAVSKHLAAFLTRAAKSALAVADSSWVRDGMVLPNKILFNGGVFKAEILRQRVLDILSDWTADHRPVIALEGAEYDLACARGATYYGAVRQSGKGLRIRSGTARSYYVGVEASMPAVPGMKPPLRGLCVVPQGCEEGTELPLLDKQFGLVVGKPVRFRFFHSMERPQDKVGSVVAAADRFLEETDGLMATLPAQADDEGQVIPVRMKAMVSETGTLKLVMFHVNEERQWNLEFNVRGQDV